MKALATPKGQTKSSAGRIKAPKAPGQGRAGQAVHGFAIRSYGANSLKAIDAIMQRAATHTASASLGDLKRSISTMHARMDTEKGAGLSRFHKRELSGDLAVNSLADGLKESLDLLNDPAALKAAGEMYKEAYAGITPTGEVNGRLMLPDPGKMLALNELRVTRINNYARAMSHWLELYFDNTDLGEGDQAQFVNETEFPVAVNYLSQDAKPMLQRAVQAYSNFLVPLRYVATQKYGYQIEDIQRGNITGPAKAAVDMAFDLALAKDQNAFTLISATGSANAIFQAFTTNNANHPELNTYNPHPTINTLNLPSTNDLISDDQQTLGLVTNSYYTGSGLTTGRLGFGICSTVLRYCNQWAGIFKDGQLQPTGIIIVPAINAADFLLLKNLVPTAAKPSMIAEALLSNFIRFEYGGVVWTIVPDATLFSGTGPGGSTYVYPILNKVLGHAFSKPKLAREVKNSDIDNNWEDVYYREPQGLYVPVQRRVNAVRVAC